MQQPKNIIKKYRVTEKASALQAQENKYTFEVVATATRRDVAEAVEKLFKVQVSDVNILNIKGKLKASRRVRGQFGKKPDIKKAVVTLKEGNAIELV